MEVIIVPDLKWTISSILPLKGAQFEFPSSALYCCCVKGL